MINAKYTDVNTFLKIYIDAKRRYFVQKCDLDHFSSKKISVYFKVKMSTRIELSAFMKSISLHVAGFVLQFCGDRKIFVFLLFFRLNRVSFSQPCDILRTFRFPP